MSIIKTFSVGEGDMFYIKHGNDNFTIIDCCLSDDDKEEIVEEIKDEKRGKNITRFISTHPDEDHIQMLDYLDDEIEILNFYCVKNETTKSEETDGFKRYKELHDSSKKAFYLEKGCSRKWMNKSDDERGSAGINILWPITSNEYFKDELQKAKDGESPNNISCIVKYSSSDGLTTLWMGDLETSFMENIEDEIEFPKVNLLFAPHHGRKTGKVPDSWIEQMDPDIIIMGESNSNDSDYSSYSDYNKIRQNSAKDIIFDCTDNKIHIFCTNYNYDVDFLDNETQYLDGFHYLGTLTI